MTSATSIAAYYTIPNLEYRQDRVLNCVIKCKGVSSNDIARIQKMDPVNVRNRIVELRKDGKVAVMGRKKDRLTGYMVYQYEAIE